MYYKIPFIAVIVVCAAAAALIHAKLSEKDCVLQAILFDIHTDVTEEELQEEFASYAEIDTGKYEVLISTSLLLSDAASGNYAMTSLSKFYAATGTGELDVCMMQEEDFLKYAESDSFLDLREVFTEEKLAEFPKLYTDSEGRVLGIFGDGLQRIEEAGGYEGQESIAGIMYNSEHKENAASFLEYLNTGEEEK